MSFSRRDFLATTALGSLALRLEARERRGAKESRRVRGAFSASRTRVVEASHHCVRE